MVITFRSTLIFCLTGLAMGLSAWSVLLSGKPSSKAHDNSTNRPDAYMEEVVAVMMNKEGKPKLKVETNQVVHYAENDVSEFNAPRVTIYRQSPEPWHVTADYAKATQGINEITFWSNVVIEHFSDVDNPLTTLHTSSLTILPEEQVAKTSEAVTMTQPDTRIDAVGMLANWKEGTVKLLSQAREEYVPKS